MNTTQTIDALRRAADQLEAGCKAPHFEPQEITIAEAFQRLRSVIPTGYISVYLPSIDSFKAGEFSMENWKVYDGAKHFESQTLLATVTACVDAHREPQGKPVAVVQVALDSLDPPEPF